MAAARTPDLPIPRPRLRQVENRSGFPHLMYEKMAPGRQFHDCIIVSGSFMLAEGTLEPADVQRGPVLADRYHAASHPELSSLKASGDTVLCKPGADVYVTGTVHAFAGRARRAWLGSLMLSRDKKVLLRKVLRFTGARSWHWGLLSGWQLGEPQATTAVELRYEHSYGGHYARAGRPRGSSWVVYPQNPAGSGFFGPGQRRAAAVPGPQLEYANQPIGSADVAYTPAGLGPIARFWQPRLRWAGTYDAAWQAQYERSTVADYPPDLDLRYFHSAPADQIVAEPLRGDEVLVLDGLLRQQRTLACQLPALALLAECGTRGGERRLLLDTLHVDLDRGQVRLTWRLTLPHHEGIEQVTLIALHGEEPT